MLHAFKKAGGFERQVAKHEVFLKEHDVLNKQLREFQSLGLAQSLKRQFPVDKETKLAQEYIDYAITTTKPYLVKLLQLNAKKEEEKLKKKLGATNFTMTPLLEQLVVTRSALPLIVGLINNPEKSKDASLKRTLIKLLKAYKESN